MGLFKRATDIVESRVNKLLDRMEDPNAMLDLSYEKMMDGLQEVKRNLADVVTEQKQVEMQARNVEKDIADRDEEARAAIKLGREDLAKEALDRKHRSQDQLANLQAALERIGSQVNRLKDAERKFQDKISTFRTEKEVTKATYSAAKSEVKIGESMAGISKEFGGVGDSLRRANEKTEQMTARAAAMEQLADEGILNDPFDSRDKVSRELDQVRRQSAVDDELEQLKKEVAGGQ